MAVVSGGSSGGGWQRATRRDAAIAPAGTQLRVTPSGSACRGLSCGVENSIALPALQMGCCSALLVLRMAQSARVNCRRGALPQALMAAPPLPAAVAAAVAASRIIRSHTAACLPACAPLTPRTNPGSALNFRRRR